MTLTDIDQTQLILACRLLETRPLSMRICDTLGLPIETGLALLPRRAIERIHTVTQKCLQKALAVALKTLDRDSPAPSSDRFHKGFVIASGFVSGIAGLAGLTLEAPITTVAMLRSIADIARSQGALLASPETLLECLQVFALSGGTRVNGAVPGYYAVRTLLSRNLGDAVVQLTARGVVDESAGVVSRFVSAIAERFSVNMSEKFAAQSIPLLGAAGGAMVNYVFMSHFQDIARGHFTVRRLEGMYGVDPILDAYQTIKMALDNPVPHHIDANARRDPTHHWTLKT